MAAVNSHKLLCGCGPLRWAFADPAAVTVRRSEYLESLSVNREPLTNIQHLRLHLGNDCF